MSSKAQFQSGINLTHLKVVRITGADAELFLQGQLTNDVSQLNASWQWSGYCNPKGRLLASLQLWRDDDVFFMLLDATITEATVKRLRMYVMRSNVQLEVMPHVVCIGELTSIEPISRRHSLQKVSPDCTVLGLGERCIRVKFNAVEQTDGTEPTEWLIRDIEQGLPRVNSLTVEQFIPQMLNFDALSGISFKKGCYTGQEIVARMHYLGKLKQRMFVCALSNRSQSVLAGGKIVDRANGRSVGNIVNALDKSNACLAVLRLDALTETPANNPFDVHGANDTVIATLTVNASQPYSFPITKQGS